jgi:hypothetical protein
MREHNRQSDYGSGGGAKSLLSRLDAVSGLVDDERYWEARGALYGKRWRQDLDLSGLAPEVLEKAQQFVDAACDELAGHDVNPHLARTYLLQARRVLTG